jgi:NADPH:quinone reductase-like Zn-dependent oxidoreductase
LLDTHLASYFQLAMSQATQKALQLTSKQGSFELVSNQPIYKPGPGYVLVKILATSLNPVDWKVQEMGIFVDRYPAILGTDIAGEVVELGEGVTRWKKGDKM